MEPQTPLIKRVLSFNRCHSAIMFSLLINLKGLKGEIVLTKILGKTWYIWTLPPLGVEEDDKFFH